MLGIRLLLHAMVRADIQSGERLVGAAFPNAIGVAETPVAHESGDPIIRVCTAVRGGKGFGSEPCGPQAFEKLR
jgi:hypothetical protein